LDYICRIKNNKKHDEKQSYPPRFCAEFLGFRFNPIEEKLDTSLNPTQPFVSADLP